MIPPISEAQNIIQLVDTHCHLDFNVFNNDRDEILADARAKGVHWILNPAIDVRTSQAIVDQVAKLEHVFAAVGVHPNDATTWNSESIYTLTQLAHHPKVVAIGEIGLDYYRDRAPKDLQRSVFLSQLELAQKMGLPVIIHTRHSISDTLSILTDWVTSLKVYNQPLAAHPGVLHSFSGNQQDAQRAIELGFCIGITGPVTFKNAQDLQKLVTALPIESILVETDAPFLSPHPHRGKRNQPGWVGLIAEKIAELQKITIEETAIITTANAQRLFAWRNRG